MNVEIANRLQTMRKKHGYSQEELAEKIGISRQAVSKWERAEASPDTDNLILLAKLYGVTLDELLRTESVPAKEGEGISLRKEDYINPQERDPAVSDGRGASVSGVREQPAGDSGSGTFSSVPPDNFKAVSGAALASETSSKVTGNNAANPNAFTFKLGGSDLKVKDPPENDGEIYPQDRAFSAQNDKNSGNVFESDVKIGQNSGNFGKPEAKAGNNANFGEKSANYANDTGNTGKYNFSGYNKNDPSLKVTPENEAELYPGGVKFKEPETGRNIPNVKVAPDKYEMTGAKSVNDRLGEFGDRQKERTEKYAGKWEQRKEKYEKRRSERQERQEKAENKKKSDKKYEKTLLDKLFPLIISMLFFLGVGAGLAGISWLLFFFIPIYYIFRYNQNRYKSGEKDIVDAIVGFMDGALPVIVTLLFFTVGLGIGFWEYIWMIFFVIPLWYTGIAAAKKRNLMLYCYPVQALWAFILFGMLFDWWVPSLFFLTTIPFYYIIVDHFQKKFKKKNEKPDDNFRENP